MPSAWNVIEFDSITRNGNGAKFIQTHLAGFHPMFTPWEKFESNLKTNDVCRSMAQTYIVFFRWINMNYVIFPKGSFIQLDFNQDQLWTTYSTEMTLGDILIPLLCLASLSTRSDAFQQDDDKNLSYWILELPMEKKRL